MDYLKNSAQKIFQYQAKLILKKYKPKVIAISGSVGKTLTKEALYLLLSRRFYVRKSERSFAAELTIPLTVIGCKSAGSSYWEWLDNFLIGLKVILWRVHYPQWLILEIDNEKSGDLRLISSLVSPDILIMTAIGEVPAHIEAFSSIEQFIFEKKLLVSSVKREGVILYNHDDALTRSIVQFSESKKISCGLQSADIVGTPLQVMYGKTKKFSFPTGMSFSVQHDGSAHSLTTHESLGVQNQYALILAFATGLEMKIAPKDIVHSLNKYIAMPGRMRIIAGIKDTLIIDDSYNSSPVAMWQAIELFGSLENSGRKILVLGDMLQLGRHSASEHRKIAAEIRVFADFVITVGLRARKISEELIEIGFDPSKVISFDASLEAGQNLEHILEPGDIVLVKGSEALRMEQVVEEVMRHPEDKEKLLVRQEEEWTKK